MTRALYRLILWLHPQGFRRRFGDEMLSIFEEKGMHYHASAMVIDGLTSLARQWALRTGAWKVLAALAGAFIQVWGCGLRTLDHKHWSRNTQDLTPYMEQVILITLGSLCILFVAVMSLTLWTMRFQRRHSKSSRLLARS